MIALQPLQRLTNLPDRYGAVDVAIFIVLIFKIVLSTTYNPVS